MDTYVFNANTAKAAQVLNGSGLDRYIYNAQDGHGIGSFLVPSSSQLYPLSKQLVERSLQLQSPPPEWPAVRL